MNSDELKKKLTRVMSILNEMMDEKVELKRQIWELKEEVFRLNNRIIKQHNTLCEHGLEEYGN